MTVFVSRETEEVMSESEFIRPKTKDLEIKVPFVSENDQLEPPPLVNYFGKRSKTVCVCVCVSSPVSKGFLQSSGAAGGQGLQRRTLSNEAKSLEGKH